MTRASLIKRGLCCGNKCINCPYTPRHNKGSKMIEIIEKKGYNLDGEVEWSFYLIQGLDEFTSYKKFNSYGDARQYIKEQCGI